MKLHDFHRAGATRRSLQETPGPESDFRDPSEARLAAALRRARSEEELADRLRELPLWQRLKARIVAVRELGAARARQVCERAYGPGAAPFPMSATETSAPAPAGPRERWDFLRARALDEMLAVDEIGTLSPDAVADLLSYFEEPVARAALWLARRRDPERAERLSRFAAGRSPSAALQPVGGDLAAATERRAVMLFRREQVDAGAVDLDDPVVQEALDRRGEGAPLAGPLRREMEERLCAGLRAVRIHTDGVADAAARALSAVAFTIGEDVFFSAAAFAPETPAGKKLLIHELTHVLQQRAGRGPVGGVGRAGDPFEREADEAAERMGSPGPAEPEQAPPTVALQASGWSGAEAGSWNAQEWTVDAEGGRRESGAGVRRVPLEGITAVIEATADEGAAGQRVIALVPTSVAALPAGSHIDVLIFYHGLRSRWEGYAEKSSGDVLDVAAHEIEQQLLGSSRPMVGILPQGVEEDRTSRFGVEGRRPQLAPSGGAEGLVAQVFTQLQVIEPAALPADAAPGRIAEVAHSGGGFAITDAMREEVAEREAAADEGREPELGSDHLQSALLFDAIHSGDLATVKHWAEARLTDDKAALEPMHTTAVRLAYLEGSTVLLGYASREVADDPAQEGDQGVHYQQRYIELRDFIDDWFENNTGFLLPDVNPEDQTVYDAWRDNYPIVPTHLPESEDGLGERVGHEGIVGGGHLGRGLAALPSGSALQRQEIGEGASAPPDTSEGTSAAPGLRDTSAARLIERCLEAARRGETGLTEAYLERTLATRSAAPEVSAAFDAAVDELLEQLGALPEGGAEAAESERSALTDAAAAALLALLERRFVADPEASSLDLLPDEERDRYRDFAWERYDYPGNEEGPHERKARRMDAALGEVRPERRANRDDDAVVAEDEFDSDAELRQHIEDELTDADGEGHQLNREAAERFRAMREAAAAEGVILSINNSHRSRARAIANAEAASNPEAVARYSSHTLGLAIDFNMSDDAQDYDEVTTRPMQNVADMHLSSVHRWLMLHAQEYGFYPWHHEPWHWEYNPPGFRERFRCVAESGCGEAPDAGGGAQGVEATQQKGGRGGGDEVRAAAAAGLAGSAEALPHLATIQSAFGRHDVGGIRAHVDGHAARGTERMGAVAFAAGEEVGFARAPDLHTTAHEAAHVLQQRAGVVPRGHVSRPGDAYEQHADAVADRVLAGQPAEPLLDAMLGPLGARAASPRRRVGATAPRAGDAVQRSTDEWQRGRTGADSFNTAEAQVVDERGGLHPEEEGEAGVRRIVFEDVAEVGGGWMIVYVPAKTVLARSTTIDVLLHFHGGGAESQEKRNPGGADSERTHDLHVSQVPQQIAAYGGPLIGIAPQRRGDGEAVVDDAIADLVFEYLRGCGCLAEQHQRGRIIISAHSRGGPLALAEANERADAGQAVNGLLLFDPYKSGGIEDEVAAFLTGRLEEDRGRLDALRGNETDQLDYLQGDGFFFREYGFNGDEAIQTIQRSINDWFAAHAAEGSYPVAVRDAWLRNYGTVSQDPGPHHWQDEDHDGQEESRSHADMVGGGRGQEQDSYFEDPWSRDREPESGNLFHALDAWRRSHPIPR